MKAKIRELQFDTRVNQGIEIIPVDDRYVKTRENLLAPHRADFYCVLWFCAGRGVHLVDFEPVRLEAGSFLFIGRDRVQLFDQENIYSAKVLLFTGELLDSDLLERSGLFSRIDDGVSLVRGSDVVVRFWKEIEAELSRPLDRYKPVLLKNHLQNFLLQAEREAGLGEGVGGGDSELFFRYKELVEMKYKEQRPVSYYTDSLGVSGKILSRVTVGFSGKTPKQVLEQRVLLEAKRMLIHRGDAGKEIGYELGFGEPTNFVKFFKKHTGVTPAVFRAGYLKGDGG